MFFRTDSIIILRGDEEIEAEGLWEQRTNTSNTSAHTERRDVRDFRANQNLHILDSPEEPLIQMTWSYREDVDHVILLQLQLLCCSSTRESSVGRTNQNICLPSNPHVNKTPHYCSHKRPETFAFLLKVKVIFWLIIPNHLVRDFQKPASFSSVPSLSSSSSSLSCFFWTWNAISNQITPTGSYWRKTWACFIRSERNVHVKQPWL